MENVPAFILEIKGIKSNLCKIWGKPLIYILSVTFFPRSIPPASFLFRVVHGVVLFQRLLWNFYMSGSKDKKSMALGFLRSLPKDL
jgi:hypothetical protein